MSAKKVTPVEPIKFGSRAEYCLECDSPLSSDGCSNPECIKSRPKYPLQDAYRKVLLGRAMELTPWQIIRRFTMSAISPRKKVLKSLTL